jgi:hypothetical protein
MSKEHVWPQWMRRGAAVQPTQVTRILGVAQTGPTELTENTNIVTHKNGSVLTTRVREVCADCNNGWMGQLETDAQPLIRRLTVRSYPLGVTTLAPKETATLSAWAVKTAWMRERAMPGRITPTQEMRTYLSEKQHPPVHTEVWAGRHVGTLEFDANVLQIDVGWSDRPWDDADTVVVAVCTLTFMGVCVAVRTANGEGVPPMTPDPNLWRPFWPNDDFVQWPPPVTASDVDVRDIGTRIDTWLSGPRITSFRSDPAGYQRIRRN